MKENKVLNIALSKVRINHSYGSCYAHHLTNIEYLHLYSLGFRLNGMHRDYDHQRAVDGKLSGKVFSTYYHFFMPKQALVDKYYKKSQKEA